jgi:hypothetical protein
MPKLTNFLILEDIRSHPEYVVYAAARRVEERARRALEQPAAVEAQALVETPEVRRQAYQLWLTQLE